MSFKRDLAKVIKANTSYVASKVWNPIVYTDIQGNSTMTIEINVSKKHKKRWRQIPLDKMLF
jgi:hypothetical protein